MKPRCREGQSFPRVIQLGSSRAELPSWQTGLTLCRHPSAEPFLRNSQWSMHITCIILLQLHNILVICCPNLKVRKRRQRDVKVLSKVMLKSVRAPFWSSLRKTCTLSSVPCGLWMKLSSNRFLAQHMKGLYTTK